MEAIGLGFAVVGVFKNCLEGYEILAGMSAQEKSAKILRCKLIVEERRLLSWGRSWGLMEHIYSGSGNNNNGNSSGSRGITSPTEATAKARFRTATGGSTGSTGRRNIKGVEWVIEEHLSSISELLSDATTLQNRYGLSSSSAPLNSAKASKVSMAKKFRWAITDKEQFKELIADLRDLNDGLQTLLPEPSQAISNQALVCEMASHGIITPGIGHHEPPAYTVTNGNGHRRSGSISSAAARMNMDDMTPPPLSREDSLIGILEEALDDYPHVQRCMMLRKAQVRAGDVADERWSPRQNLEIASWTEKLTLNEPPPATKDSRDMEIIRRTAATYVEDTWDEFRNCLVTNSYRVLVEWKPYEDDEDLTKERVQRLAELFHPAGGYGAFTASDGEMRILECVGWFHDGDRMRYGLVFHMPTVDSAFSPSVIPPSLHPTNSSSSLAPPQPPRSKSPDPRRRSNSSSPLPTPKSPSPPPLTTALQPVGVTGIATLDDFLPSDSKLSKPDLGSRVILSRMLARSLLQLHAANVLHKDLCSHNVVFFTSASVSSILPDDVTAVSAAIANPYVSGFALARVDDAADDRTVTLASHSAARAMASSMLPYQHPSYSPALLRQICGVASTTSMYKRAYDVYSLGCVLLEIGLWRKLRTLGWRKEYEKSSGRERWRRKLVVICDELGARCGKIYEDTVRRCLLYGEEKGDGGGGGGYGYGGKEEGDLLGFCYDVLGRLEGIKV